MERGGEGSENRRGVERRGKRGEDRRGEKERGVRRGVEEGELEGGADGTQRQSRSQLWAESLALFADMSWDFDHTVEKQTGHKAT